MGLKRGELDKKRGTFGAKYPRFFVKDLCVGIHVPIFYKFCAFTFATLATFATLPFSIQRLLKENKGFYLPISISLVSVSAEEVARIDFVLYIVEASIVAVGDDGLRLCFELCEVVHHDGTKESRAVG